MTTRVDDHARRRGDAAISESLDRCFLGPPRDGLRGSVYAQPMRVAQVLWAAPGGGDATFPGTARAGFEDYKEQIRSTKQRMKEAEQNGDEAEKERLKEELGRLKAEYARYQKENYVRNSGGMMGGGIALASVGGFGLLVGSIFTLGNDDTKTTGYFLIGMGIACIGAGIPLAIVGARRVPKESRGAGASPILIVSPRGAALHVTF